jgi:hypothetical protein
VEQFVAGCRDIGGGKVGSRLIKVDQGQTSLHKVVFFPASLDQGLFYETG